MSLKALVEAVIHLESFRNIELFYQGLYFLRCKVYSQYTDSDVKNYASPYCSFVSQI